MGSEPPRRAKAAPILGGRSSRRLAVAACFVLACSASRSIPRTTASDLLPPAPPWSGASEALVAAPDDPWITPAERSGFVDTPGYDETIAYLRRLAASSRRLALRRFGKSAQGRDLHVVIASREGASDPKALRRNGRPTLFAQAGIHAGEIDGKDAGLMLLRDLALGKKASLLERANLLFVPVFNVDGHERTSEWNRPNQRGPARPGWRTTAQNLNLNRDYTKLDAPETRAMLELLAAWEPDLCLDLHVTDGIDYPHDITFGYNGSDSGFAYSPAIARWLDAHYRPAVTRALEAAGHTPGPLIFAMDSRDLTRGLSDPFLPPRFSTGYGDLRHLPSVLVENHSLKPYRRRVLGTYVLLEASLEALGHAPAELRAAIDADRARRPASIPMNWGWAEGDADRAVAFPGFAYETYDSPASGASEVRWLGIPKTYEDLPVHRDRPKATLARPRAYWVPGTKPEVIDRLRRHGIRMEILERPRTVRIEMARLVDPEPSRMPYEGRHTLTTSVETTTRVETYPAGSARIPTDQPLGDLAMVLLEPESGDSFLAWGFFPEILQRTEYMEGYVLAPLAERMLAEDPALEREFRAKLAEDPAFARDREARLEWFYRRSPYPDERHRLYPVGRER